MALQEVRTQASASCSPGCSGEVGRLQPGSARKDEFNLEDHREPTEGPRDSAKNERGASAPRGDGEADPRVPSLRLLALPYHLVPGDRRASASLPPTPPSVASRLSAHLESFHASAS